jgi:uncharacterized protein (TIGR02391 family)
MKPEIEAKIERQQIVAEANPGGYKPVRLTKIKYKACPYYHIDLRQFQRGYDDEGEEKWYPTKIGFRFPEREFARMIKAYTLTPETYIHPVIQKKCIGLLNAHEFESAVIKAFKAIETTVRKAISAKSEDIGVSLIRKAFHPETGPLTDTSLPIPEREAFSNYIAGAFGFYKNPCSHRDVEITFISAFERIVVASDLLKVIDRAMDRNKDAQPNVEDNEGPLARQLESSLDVGNKRTYP